MTLMAVIAMTFKTLNRRVCLPVFCSLTLERKKKSKDPAAFATAMSAILSSSLKAHSRAVSYLIFWFLTLGSNSCSFKISLQNSWNCQSRSPNSKSNICSTESTSVCRPRWRFINSRRQGHSIRTIHEKDCPARSHQTFQRSSRKSDQSRGSIIANKGYITRRTGRKGQRNESRGLP